MNQYFDGLTKNTSTTTKIVDSLKAELDKIKQKRIRVEEKYLEEKLPEDRYDVWISKLDNQEVEISSELENLPKSINLDSTLELLEKFKHQAVNIGEMFYYGKDDVKADLLKSALWNCQIRDQKITATRYKKPFAFFDGVSKTTDLDIWRRRWDSNPRGAFAPRLSKPLELTTIRRLQDLTFYTKAEETGLEPARAFTRQFSRLVP